MQQFTVTGMHCAACSASVEKAVKKVPGVESCAVSLLTNSMGIEGTAAPDAIIQAVQNAGYGASLKGTGDGTQSPTAAEEQLAGRRTRRPPAPTRWRTTRRRTLKSGSSRPWSSCSF